MILGLGRLIWVSNSGFALWIRARVALYLIAVYFDTFAGVARRQVTCLLLRQKKVTKEKATRSLGRFAVP